MEHRASAFAASLLESGHSIDCGLLVRSIDRPDWTQGGSSIHTRERRSFAVPSARLAIRLAAHVAQPWVHGGRRRNPRARHWRQLGDLQPAERSIARATQISDPSRVAFLLGVHDEQGMQFNLTLADYVDLQERSRTLESVAAYTYVSANLTGGDLPGRVQAYRVTTNTFSLLGVPAALGRSFHPADGDQGRDDVVAPSAMAGGSDGSVAPQRSSGDAWTSTASRTKSSASCCEHSKSRLQLQR